MSTPASLRSGTASQQAFRDVMAAVPSSVAVVTALDGTRPHGTTVSAFASLSLTPPMVLVSLDRRSHLLAVGRRSGRFGVNVLGAHQADLASVFSRSGPDKFTESTGRRTGDCHGCRTPPHGSPPRWPTASTPATTPSCSHT